jgi:endonuclease YncB( thermonuclease family)
MCEELTKEQYDTLCISDCKVEKFSLTGRTILGKVISVYDGDTCKVNLFLSPNSLKQFTIRMNGYDSPELKTKNSTEKKCGLISKNTLNKLLEDHIVKLECLEHDKYGRILANLFVKLGDGSELNVNKYMIDNRFGHSYDGGTKKTFEELYEQTYYDLNRVVLVPESMNYL